MDFESCFELGVDFMDMNRGLIYKIQEFKQALSNGNPLYPLRIVTIEGEDYGEVDKDYINDLIRRQTV